MTADPKSLSERLKELREELHVNELRHSGTQDGNIYSRWGSVVGAALIDHASQAALLEEAREVLASLVGHIERITYRDGTQLRLDDRVPHFEKARAYLAKTEPT